MCCHLLSFSQSCPLAEKNIEYGVRMQHGVVERTLEPEPQILGVKPEFINYRPSNLEQVI